MTSEGHAESTRTEEARGRRLAFLSLAALGVVYGDIGTSPLYAIRECFHGTYAIEVTRANILGVLSLVLWALLIVVTIKYLSFILRADNRGEGGVIALTALIIPQKRTRSGRILFLGALGLFGAVVGGALALAINPLPGASDQTARHREPPPPPSRD